GAEPGGPAGAAAVRADRSRRALEENVGALQSAFLRACERSGLEAVEAHPGVGLGRTELLDVEAVATVGRLHGSRPPERRALEELLAKVLGRPDLPRLDQRLDARRAQDRVAADDDGALVRAAPVG